MSEKKGGSGRKKGAAITLETTRFPKAGPQGHSAPKGRIHSVKEYVNYIDEKTSIAFAKEASFLIYIPYLHMILITL